MPLSFSGARRRKAQDRKIRAARHRLLGRHRSDVARLRAQAARARDRRQRDRMPAPGRPRAQSRRLLRGSLRQQLGQQARRSFRRTGRALDHEGSRSHELHAHAGDPRSAPQGGFDRGAIPPQRLGDDGPGRSRQARRRSRPARRTRLDRSRLPQDRHRRRRLRDPAILHRTLRYALRIAVQLEVNFVGTDQPDEHTFHNTDRFMRARASTCSGSTCATYSTRALPARYVWPTPAETLSGRPFQGEAYYARDLLAHGTVGVSVQARSSPSSPRCSRPGRCPTWPPSCCWAGARPWRRSSTSTRVSTCWRPRSKADRSRRSTIAIHIAKFETDAPSFYRREGDYTLGERLRRLARRGRRLLAPRRLSSPSRPPSRWRLLPVDDGVAGLVGLPALARVGDGIVVAAVEQLEAALVVGHALRLRAVGDEQEGGAVGILVEMRQPHRLAVGLAVLGRAMRQEAVGIVGPEMGVERIDALGRAQHHHRPLARLQGLGSAGGASASSSDDRVR